MSFNNVGRLITSTITTLQHVATLYHTSPNYTSLHLSTLHFLSFTLHYPPINFSYRSISPHITKLDTELFSHPQTYFQSNEPLHCLKELLSISLHFTLYIYIFFHLSYQPFTSLYFAFHIYNSLRLTSFAFTFSFLSPSLLLLFYTFLILVLKVWVLPWEVPIATSGSWFQSVVDLFIKEYFPMSVLCRWWWWWWWYVELQMGCHPVAVVIMHVCEYVVYWLVFVFCYKSMWLGMEW